MAVVLVRVIANNMTKVLITGGAGYIGSVLTERLLDAGFDVTVLDNLTYQQHSLFHLAHHPNFSFVQGDVRDEKVMRSVLAGADFIIPLAAIVGAPACDRDPWLAESVNYGAVKILNDLRSQDQLVVFPNTESVYGAKTGSTLCTEDDPIQPTSLYGSTKMRAEEELLSSPNSVVLRLATVFGMSPRMRRDLLINHFVYAALTDGYMTIFEKNFKRNFVHVRDVADCFLHCIQNFKQMAGRPYNLGHEAANLSKEELALKIKEYIPGFYIHFSDIGSDPDKRNYIISSGRLRRAGFEAKRTVDEGIKELIKGYRMFGRDWARNI